MADFVGVVNKEQGFIEVIGAREDTEYQHYKKIYNIIYEGELYNSDEVLMELLEKGYMFDTYLEEEVILKAYIEWGEGCLYKFEGVFSIAIWNDDKKSLFLARDPMGAKSLYYSIIKDNLIFSDEIKNILKHPNIKPEVTYEGICEVLLLGPSKRPDSAVFRNILSLDQGHFAIYQDGRFRINKYFDFRAIPHVDDFETTSQKIRELLIESIIKQSASDKEICTLLSGGLDSSIVTTVVADILRELGKKTTTISVDYEGNDIYFTANEFQPNSDSYWTKKVSEFLNTEHIVINLSSGELIDNLGEALRARDLPGMADIDSSLLSFCKKIRNYAQIGLGGECADEIFGGYPWFHKEELLNSSFFPWISSLDERVNFLSEDVTRNINAKEFALNIYENEIKKVPAMEGESEEEKKIRKMGILTYKWFLPNLLIRQDKMSKYAGINLRAPFCNYKLMEYVFNIPWEMRRCNGREKGLLRYAFKDLLPDEIVNRKKSPYPRTYNPEYTDIVSTELSHIIENPTSPIHEIVNINKVKELINTESDLSLRPWYGQLMRKPQVIAFLIQVNMWLKDYNINIV